MAMVIPIIIITVHMETEPSTMCIHTGLLITILTITGLIPLFIIISLIITRIIILTILLNDQMLLKEGEILLPVILLPVLDHLPIQHAGREYIQHRVPVVQE